MRPSALNRLSLLLPALLLCQLIATGAAAAPATGPRHEYVMGVFPFIPAASIEGIFAPLAAEISRAIGRPVKLQTAPSFERFMSELSQQTYQLAFVQPFDYVEIARPRGYLPLAARNDKLSSHLVVREDSPVKTIGDLKGKTLGMPPRSAAVSVMNQVAIKQAGLKPDTDVKFVYLASHQACLQQLLIGTVHACGVSPPGVRLVEHQMKTRFRLIHATPTIPSPLFVVHKDLPRKEQEQIRAVLLSTGLEGVDPALRTTFLGDVAKPFRSATDRDYDTIRSYLKLLRQH